MRNSLIFYLIVSVNFLVRILCVAEDKNGGFALYLFSKQDYYRAITEAERIIYLHPEDREKVLGARLLISSCYLKGRRFEEGISVLSEMAEEEEGEISSLSTLQLALAYNLTDKYGVSEREASRFIQKAEEPFLKNAARHLIGVNRFLLEDFSGAKEVLQENTEAPIWGEYSKDLIEHIQKWDQLKKRSPLLSQLLSTFIPGAGQLYCHRVGDAIASAIINGVLISGAYNAFKNDEDVMGVLLCYFGISFYLGNIYSARSAAIKFNRAQEDKYFDQAEQYFHLELLQSQLDVQINQLVKKKLLKESEDEDE